MEKQMKKQKGFAIVNIFMGVVLTMSGVMLFADPSAGPGGIICLGIGLPVWISGAYMLQTIKNHRENEIRIKKAARINTVSFVVSSLILAMVVVLMILGPLL